MKVFSWCGLVLTILYVPFASWVAWDEFFHCGGGLDISLCGLGSAIVTLPVTLLFELFGVKVNFPNHTNADIALQALIIAFCGILVYFIGWVLGWIGNLLLQVTGLRKS